MATIDTSETFQRESDEWSDPLVGIQFEQFRAYVDERRQTTVAATEALAVAEYLCDWSRNLLNRAFGRATQGEMVAITRLFKDTGTIVKSWAENIEDPEILEKIESYATHIRQRTGIVEARKTSSSQATT